MGFVAVQSIISLHGDLSGNAAGEICCHILCRVLFTASVVLPAALLIPLKVSGIIPLSLCVSFSSRRRRFPLPPQGRQSQSPMASRTVLFLLPPEPGQPPMALPRHQAVSAPDSRYPHCQSPQGAQDHPQSPPGQDLPLALQVLQEPPALPASQPPHPQERRVWVSLQGSLQQPGRFRRRERSPRPPQ